MPTTRTLLIENGTLLSPASATPLRRGYSLLIEDGIISRVAPRSRFSGYAGRRLDARGKVVMPGLINAHTHFYSTFARGLTKARPARNFMGVLRNLWWRLDSALTLEDCYYSALVALLDSIRHGTTTVIDHHASPRAIGGSLDAIARTVRETGLRACLCYEVTDRHGRAGAHDGIAENVHFIRRCQAEGDSQLRALFGLHAAFTLNDATLADAAGLGHDLQTGFHIHVAEEPTDRAVARLHRAGILGPRSLAAHCIHLTDRDRGLLADSETAVLHNPQSNLNNAVGIADLVALARRGALVGLGTDAMTTNLLEEVRVALWAQHLGAANPSVGFAEVTGALCTGNPAIAERIFGLRFDGLEPGCVGDLAIFDYDPPTPLEPENVLGHVVFGLSQTPVDTTIAGGRILMKHRRLQLGLDEARVNARARELAKDLWQRL